MDHSLKTKKVIIVEDDPFLGDLIIKYFDKEGMDIELAIDGEKAMKQIRIVRPALVVLDLILPGIDGFEVLRRIKKDPELQIIPVVIFSNLEGGGEVEMAHNLGAKEYLIKSKVGLSALKEKIQQFI